jgi:hypothetical protein
LHAGQHLTNGLKQFSQLTGHCGKLAIVAEVLTHPSLIVTAPVQAHHLTTSRPQAYSFLAAYCQSQVHISRSTQQAMCSGAVIILCLQHAFYLAEYVAALAPDGYEYDYTVSQC